MFTCGFAEKGRLGLFDDGADKKDVVLTFKEIESLSGNQMVCCFAGTNASFAITQKGKIFSWGENKNFIMGELSNDEKAKDKIDILPKPILLPINVSILGVGGCDLDIFKVYFLSNENTKLTYNIAKKVKITKLACGGTHSLALTNSGDILSWGFGKQVSQELKRVNLVKEKT